MASKGYTELINKRVSNQFAVLMEPQVSPQISPPCAELITSKRRQRRQKMTLDEFKTMVEEQEQSRRKQLALAKSKSVGRKPKAMLKVVIKSGQTAAKVVEPKQVLPTLVEMPALCQTVCHEPTGMWTQGCVTIHAAKDLEDPTVVADRHAKKRSEMARRLHRLQARVSSLSQDCDEDSSDEESVYEDEMVTVIGRLGQGEIAEKELTKTAVVHNWFDGELSVAEQSEVPENWDDWE